MVTTYINRLPEPKDPRTGRRRPHVPSSKPTMSKNHQPKSHHQAKPSDKIRRTTNLPDFYLGGLGVRLCWRPSVLPSREDGAASVSGQIWSSRDSVKGGDRLFLAFAKIAPPHGLPGPVAPRGRYDGGAGRKRCGVWRPASTTVKCPPDAGPRATLGWTVAL